MKNNFHKFSLKAIYQLLPYSKYQVFFMPYKLRAGKNNGKRNN